MKSNCKEQDTTKNSFRFFHASKQLCHDFVSVLRVESKSGSDWAIGKN